MPRRCIPEEHSAAVTDEKRQAAEQGFSSGKPPRPNLLACTPTLEMGINIGDLEAVAMRNIPPSPANYAQRSGRTGRKSRMGITAGFSRNTPHDGYFFDHPDEMIAGAIPPPQVQPPQPGGDRPARAQPDPGVRPARHPRQPGALPDGEGPDHRAEGQGGAGQGDAGRPGCDRHGRDDSGPTSPASRKASCRNWRASSQRGSVRC